MRRGAGAKRPRAQPRSATPRWFHGFRFAPRTPTRGWPVCPPLRGRDGTGPCTEGKLFGSKRLLPKKMVQGRQAYHGAKRGVRGERARCGAFCWVSEVMGRHTRLILAAGAEIRQAAERLHKKCVARRGRRKRWFWRVDRVGCQGFWTSGFGGQEMAACVVWGLVPSLGSGRRWWSPWHCGRRGRCGNPRSVRPVLPAPPAPAPADGDSRTSQ